MQAALSRPVMRHQQAVIGSGEERFGDDVEPDGDDHAGKGQREHVLRAPGEMMGELDADQAAERAADDEQERQRPVDQARPA